MRERMTLALRQSFWRMITHPTVRAKAYVSNTHVTRERLWRRIRARLAGAMT